METQTDLGITPDLKLVQEIDVFCHGIEQTTHSWKIISKDICQYTLGVSC